MPDGLAPQVIATAGPLVFATFVEHYLTPKKRDAEGKRTAGSKDLMYDEAFQIGKTFLKIANDHTCASLQKFGATRTPSPPWVAVHRLLIPQRSLSESAGFLIEALGGEEMAYKIAGGTKWWQVRAGHGVEAEWIVMKDEYRRSEKQEKKYRDELRKESKEGNASPKKGEPDAMEGEEEGGDLDSGFIPEMDKLRCMLYIHGGAYYWGSINTHRYTIWRFARKMHGRCFAVNYRTPQYPFPCAIQDVLAAYLYLVNPPKDAPHRPVKPKDIILAGDSAGGGLCWALLQILRDTPGLELPAGAVLISPWSDLTHSFPSVMKNTATDVVPAYSFIHKPSSLWPPPPPPLTAEMQTNISKRVKETAHKMRHPHHNHEGDDKGDSWFSSHKSHRRKSIHTSDPDASGRLHKLFEQKKEDIKNGKEDHQIGSQDTCINPSENFYKLSPRSAGAATSTLAQVGYGMRMEVYDEPVVVDTQIQLYCTNGQLCHPWISPVLGYLGGLPPLYILAGDDEVLRDEIIYCAHKAARPEEYPLRDDVRDLLPSMRGIEERHKPTEVHLQVFDGVGHDLTLFSMTKPARGAYRSIATFCRYVTPSNPGGLPSEESSPIASPGVRTPVRRATTDAVAVVEPLPPHAEGTGDSGGTASTTVTETRIVPEPLVDTPHSGLSIDTNTEAQLSGPSPTVITQRLQKLKVDTKQQERQGSRISRMSTMFWPSPTSSSPGGGGVAGGSGGNDAHKLHHKDRAHHYPPGTCGYLGVYAGQNPFHDGNMIRERVDFTGNVRPLEPPEELAACTMPLSETGYIKEGPAMRYIEGQAKWDRKFSRVRKKVERHRKRNLKKAKEHDADEIARHWGMMGAALAAPAQAVAGQTPMIPPPEGAEHDTAESSSATSSDSESLGDGGDMDVLGATWGWALNGEAPPPSAIVSRRDIPEGRQLALLGGQAETSSKQSPALSLWVVMATLLGGNGKELVTDAARIRMEKHEKHEQHKREKQAKENAKDDKPGPLHRLTSIFKK